MRRIAFLRPALPLALFVLLPYCCPAQSLGDQLYSLHDVLQRLYGEMLPLCNRMIGIGRAIAGFAALCYIAVRLWRHISRAEAVDVFPLLRPFALGLAIAFFPTLLAMINGVMQPVVTATAAMGKDAQRAMYYHIELEEKAALDPQAAMPPLPGADDHWYPSGAAEGLDEPGLLSSFFSSGLKSMFQSFIRQLIEVLYVAAGLAVDTIRTFYLIVLAIIGPLVLGLSVFDGFQQSFIHWVARYLHVFMWLPVANLFGAISARILENMMRLDQSFFSSSVYLIFMVISIIGYTTVPSVASYIVQAGSGDTLLHKINRATHSAARSTAVAAAL